MATKKIRLLLLPYYGLFCMTKTSLVCMKKKIPLSVMITMKENTRNIWSTRASREDTANHWADALSTLLRTSLHDKNKPYRVKPNKNMYIQKQSTNLKKY